MHAAAVRIHVAPVTPASADAVRALRLGPGQDAYAGDPALNLRIAQDDPRCEPMAVFADDAVIGFYRLDFRAEAILGRPFGAAVDGAAVDGPSVDGHAVEGAVVALRALLIDARQQRRGLGLRAVQALCADIERRHSLRRLLLLLVHCRNQPAIATYRRAGFVDTGQLFEGGRAGPQHLMLRTLGARPAGGA
jgi:GNAT superfamily N-acetyltransferase